MEPTQESLQGPVAEAEKTASPVAGDETTKKAKKRKSISYVAEVLIYLALIFACVYVVPNYVVQRTVVSGKSMQDTLQDKDSLLVDKLSYRFTNPKRYDIIVFYPKGKDVNEYFVKRIYGLPGETVQIKDNDIYINGEIISDPYAKDSMSTAGIAEEPITLGEDEFFVLGDHRSISLDSRYDETLDPDGPGPVKKENIAGKVFFRIWPLSSFGKP